MLPATKVCGPRKKLRGKRRRLRALRIAAECFSLDVREGNWWDLWHKHVDWAGYGNTMVGLRRAYVSALLIMFQRAGQQLAAARLHYQIFISLDADDASNDALYVHSPNPNASNFPYLVESTDWGDADLEVALSRLVSGLEIRLGHMRWTDADRERHVILLYSPSFGVPIEKAKLGDSGMVS